ncbi:hypothetical protein [Endozoicomonas elysicola]|uniref:Uncharacterized protein n=1 Tax=Endozoicomonas elysicola TaxID=305900 RepID=A0A081KF99_9GAMM|nr:hypothetical protein [Endozoicomonas elysicola]KEI72825.1 hypothetical protein GV64_20740 [Endozoicomonas elysicola]
MTSITGPSINPIPSQNQPPSQTGKVDENSNIAQLFSGCRCDNGKQSIQLPGNFSSLQTAADKVPDLAGAKAGQSINNSSENSTLDQVIDTGGKILDGALALASFVAMVT